MNQAKLEDFVGKILGEIAGAVNVPLIRVGDRLGIYTAMHAAGPMTAQQICEKVGIAPRYGREWLSNQAASGYLAYDAEHDTFELPPEQAAVFADEDSPVYMMGAFDLVAAMMENQAFVEPAFRTGGGVGWGDMSQCQFCAAGRFFRPSYQHNLVENWLPAVEGIVDRLRAGARVADVGCGHGFSTVFMAKEFPQSQFFGYDFHPSSIEQARRHAQQHGVENITFEVATAADFPDRQYDFVTFFDCLHDMGDPAGAARHVRETLSPDGLWMVVEPMAADRLQDNIALPFSRIYYAASTLICVPTSLAQAGRAALGAQAGFERLSGMIRDGGFSRVRKVVETPFNMVIDARA
ncbi:MAG: methyltransferase domain-containing protein [Rhodospirillales bacterium]|nr:methyltransferase domain-containing protein [Rhodospirillales bacterium]